MIRLGDQRPWARAYGRSGRSKPRRVALAALGGGAGRQAARPGLRFTRSAGATLIVVVVSAIGWALLIAIVLMVTHHHPAAPGG